MRAPALTGTESANTEHPMGLGSPQEPGGRAGMRGFVLERCCDSPSTEGLLLGSIFCHSNACWPARLDSCVASGKEQLHVSHHLHVTHSRLAQALSSPPRSSIVAGSSMLLPCICLFSLQKIFVQQQNLISKPLCVPAVCSQLEFKTSARRVGISA